MRSTPEPGIGEGVDAGRERSAPELLRHLDVTLAPGVADQLGVEVAALLTRQRCPERVVERQHHPAARTKRRRERLQRHRPVAQVVQGERAGDPVARRGRDRQRLGQIGNHEAPTRAATSSGLLDHSPAQVDADRPRPVREQPFALRTGTAPRVEHDLTGQRQGHQAAQRGTFQAAVVRTVVGRRRPHAGQPVVGVPGAVTMPGRIVGGVLHSSHPAGRRNRLPGSR